MQAKLPTLVTPHWELQQLNRGFRGIISPPTPLTISNSTPTYLYDKRRNTTTDYVFNRDLLHALVLLNPNASGTYIYIAFNQIVAPATNLYHMVLDGGYMDNLVRFCQADFITLLASGAGTAAIAWTVNHPDAQCA